MHFFFYILKEESEATTIEKKGPSEYSSFKLGNISGERRFVKPGPLHQLVSTLTPSHHYIVPEDEYERKGTKHRKQPEKMQTNTNAANLVIAVISEVLEVLAGKASSVTELSRRVTISKEDVEIAIRTSFPPNECESMLKAMNNAYDLYMKSTKSSEEEEEESNSSSVEEESDDEKKPDDEDEEEEKTVAPQDDD